MKRSSRSSPKFGSCWQASAAGGSTAPLKQPKPARAVAAALACCLWLHGISSEAAQPPERSSAADAQPSVLKLRPVPVLRGKRVSVARQLLRLRQLKSVGGVFYISPANWRTHIKLDTVSLQTPQPKSLVPPNSVVAHWVFLKADDAQRVVKIPNVRGMSIDRGKKLLARTGLGCFYSWDAGAAETRAVIADHFPTHGQSAYEGTELFLKLRVAP